MTSVERLVVNCDRIIRFLREFVGTTEADVSIDWVNNDGSITTITYPNIKKIISTVNTAISDMNSRVDSIIDNITDNIITTQTISEDIIVPDGKNMVFFSPVEIEEGVTITIEGSGVFKII